MALKHFKPTTPSQRHLVLVDKSDLYKGKPVKSLVKGLTKSGGRNNNGHITARFIGGGHKRKYRMIDFKRTKQGLAEVKRIEYDPNRTSFIALIEYGDGELSYIIAPQRLRVGDKVESGKNADIKPGNAMCLRDMPVGTLVHNVELKPGKGGQIARSAGSYVQLAGRDQGYAQIKLSSGELRMVRADCMATIGAVSNQDHQNEKLGKAGRRRWAGKMPHNRGTSMNPVDHPHGGGEGKAAGGRPSVTPWGKPTKGAKTRKPKGSDKYIIRSRHKNKKR